ncbi:DUF1039 domain-containing protein [Pandoraea capi]|uniref:DUF1039 domain-containing protein n=1 Tax=Pandoraea capi TaxID=2508286 RepID=UPI0015827059
MSSTPSNPAVSSTASRPEAPPTPWLVNAVRQQIVELALAGAQHGMEAEARAILAALPSLVPQDDARQCLHAALLIALGDTVAARSCLQDLVARGQADVPTANVLRQWLDATDAGRSPRHVVASAASPVSPAPWNPSHPSNVSVPALPSPSSDLSSVSPAPPASSSSSPSSLIPSS